MRSFCTHILLLGLVLSSLFVRAQKADIPTYNFLDSSSFDIEHYGQSRQMFAPLVDKFHSMVLYADKKIDILHLGDSHIQADLFTGQTRKDFQSFMPGLEASRGMVTPFLKGGPSSYRLTFSSGWSSENILSGNDIANKGLWGTTVYTDSDKQTIFVEVNHKNPIKYDFNTFRVYHSPLKDGQTIKIDERNIGYGMICCQQDGYTEFTLSDYVSSIHLTIDNKNNQNLYIYGFYFGNDNAGIVYNASGCIGVGANHYIHNAGLFVKQLKSLSPAMVIVSLGTNDTYEDKGELSFESNLTALVSKIREACPNIPVLLVTPPECYWHKKKINPRMTQTIEIIRKVAKDNDCALFDLYKALGGENSAKKLHAKGLMQADLVHLSAKGYELAGNLLYNALWQEFMEKQ